MRVSVFTPTHQTQHLKRLEESLKNQISKDFEWLILPNGDVSLPKIEFPQARIVEYRGKTQNIGELKNYVCQAAKGEILLEVDHDDELTPNAVERVIQEFDKAPVDFVYSNCCEIKEGNPFIYSQKFGWKYRDFKWQGIDQKEAIAFDPCPANFSKVWYAPNHLRAWRTEFYRDVGGHDRTKDVLDDHDLSVRTYIAGKVRKIDECLYIYHVHPENTCYGEKNKRIQQETLEIHDQYIYQLVEKWCDLKGLRKIDLCGGFGKPEGYESIDLEGNEIQADLNESWPFEDGEVGVFRAHDALEHLRDPIHVMKEAYRCLAPEGWFLTQTPSTDGRGAFQDPTHVSFWNSNSFWYYTKKEQAKYIGTPVRFQLNRIKDFYPNQWCENHLITYVKADLLKFQGRTPGVIQI